MAHLGIPIFKETKILFKNNSITERNKQSIALLIAKQLSEIVFFFYLLVLKINLKFEFRFNKWFGNFVTFKWWNELWLEEALGKYKI